MNKNLWEQNVEIWELKLKSIKFSEPRQKKDTKKETHPLYSASIILQWNEKSSVCGMYSTFY